MNGINSQSGMPDKIIYLLNKGAPLNNNALREFKIYIATGKNLLDSTFIDNLIECFKTLDIKNKSKLTDCCEFLHILFEHLLNFSDSGRYNDFPSTVTDTTNKINETYLSKILDNLLQCNHINKINFNKNFIDFILDNLGRNWRFSALLVKIYKEASNSKILISSSIKSPSKSLKLGKLISTLDNFQTANFIVELISNIFPRRSLSKTGVLMKPVFWEHESVNVNTTDPNEMFFNSELYPQRTLHGSRQCITFILNVFNVENFTHLYEFENISYLTKNTTTSKRAKKFCKKNGYVQVINQYIYIWDCESIFIRISIDGTKIYKDLQNNLKIELARDFNEIVWSTHVLALQNLKNASCFILTATNTGSVTGILKAIKTKKISESIAAIFLNNTEFDNDENDQIGIEPSDDIEQEKENVTAGEMAQIHSVISNGNMNKNVVEHKANDDNTIIESKQQLSTPKTSLIKDSTLKFTNMKNRKNTIKKMDRDPSFVENLNSSLKVGKEPVTDDENNNNNDNNNNKENDNKNHRNNNISDQDSPLTKKNKLHSTKDKFELGLDYSLPLIDSNPLKVSNRDPSLIMTGINKAPVYTKKRPSQQMSLKQLNGIRIKTNEKRKKSHNALSSNYHKITKKTLKKDLLKHKDLFKNSIVRSTTSSPIISKDNKGTGVKRELALSKPQGLAPAELMTETFEKAMDNKGSDTKNNCDHKSILSENIIANNKDSKKPNNRNVVIDVGSSSENISLHNDDDTTDNNDADKLHKKAIDPDNKITKTESDKYNNMNETTLLPSNTSMSRSVMLNDIEKDNFFVDNTSIISPTITEQLQYQIYNSIKGFSIELTNKMNIINEELNKRITKEFSNKYINLFHQLQENFASDVKGMIDFINEIQGMLHLPEKQLLECINQKQFVTKNTVGDSTIDKKDG
ncbi:Red1p SCDLUD_000915 [Saccharomycodes ludwigii]|uniref:Red1p n=1 Tax=Saccharomycodes ludwigii TaxID=36035 RepID=UPI001E8AB01E|nr:hypothetical protein SCDLUD_000915 [Saccharomycodes ludwigii]KAH3903290.1 hypothetical protein SCDLUD_000915 [Saccharomycodes ludwigii]